MIDGGGMIPLLRRTKPDWQAGKLNGVGGHIEANETPDDCMVREWHEETGDDHADWRKFATLIDGKRMVHFYAARVAELPSLPPWNDAGEWFELHNISDALKRIDLIDNLHWLLPMAFKDRSEPLGCALTMKVAA
jgi:8-oxo-dGTP diphosphatase